MAKTKRVLAIIGVVLLLGCYVSTLISALMGSDATQGLFMASLFCSIGLPIVLYGYMILFKYLKSKSEPKEKDAPNPDSEISKYSSINTRQVDKEK